MSYKTSRRSGDDGEPDIQIGDFVRGKEIGKGSFATVYIASHKSKRSYAAVKVVIQKKLTRKLKDNLDSEIRILKSLQHPHIVALHTCTETLSHIYLVMEYCQLSDLAQFMKKREQLTQLPETADIFKKYPNSQYGLNEVLVRHFVKQIASALEYLRLRNLIHRDIKPQNLLLNPSPMFMARQKPEDVPLAASEHSLVPAVGVESLPMLKIADFGFARHLPQQMMAETLCGSPLYMAPEILSYHKYDAIADLWSVGTVTYEMMVGRPPFRAANHIELLKKIEEAKDRIPFPTGLAISNDLHRLIRDLLRRQPTERISFSGFFKSIPVTGPIPGLVGEDIPRTASVPMPESNISELTRRMQRQAIDDTLQDAGSRETNFPQTQPSAGIPNSPGDISPLTIAPAAVIGTPQKPHAPSRGSTAGASRPMDIRKPTRQDDRPALAAHATAPARDLTLGQQYSARNPTGIQRRSSRQSQVPSTSVPRDTMAPPSRTSTRTKTTVEPSEADKTAHDLAFEKEYVLVEKKSVEVNAFADELAASPHLYNRGAAGHNTALVRRSTSQGLSAHSNPQQVSPSNAMQLAHNRRSDSGHMRKASFERRFAPNPASATNMLSKALNMANARLFGVLGASPPIAGMSPPRGYTAFPSYPTPSVGLAITTGKEEARSPQDEDTRILRIVEEAATRSDTVYSFAEVKYRQLLPATPSADEGPSIRQIGALEKPTALTQSGGRATEDDQELTQIAVVAVSEEALVLFVKALSILAKSIDLASYWWSQHRHRPSPPSPDSPLRQPNPDTSRRMNNVVQWMRNRFNECLEKSEVVGRRLVEAQKHLPTDHPGHPSNHTQFTGAGSSSTAKPNKLSGSGSSSSLGATAENIQLTSGVTAEKMMFERAVEMSRAAAVNELVGEDLRGCEISYRTAVILLEAVLEGDDEPLMGRKEREKKQEAKGGEEISGLEGEDRRAVTQLLDGTRHRLRSLVRKIQAQMQAEREIRRLSSTGAMPTAGGYGPGGHTTTTTTTTTTQKLKAGSPVLMTGTPPR